MSTPNRYCLMLFLIRALSVLFASVLLAMPVVQAEKDWVAYAQKELVNPRSSEKKRMDAIGLLKVRSSNEQAAIVLGQVLADDPSVKVRKAAASALWGHDYTLLVETQLRGALDDDAEVSVRAAGALHAAGIPADEVADGFRNGLNSSNRGTAYNSARGLVGVDPPASLVPGILAYLDWQLETPDNRGAWSAQEALEKLSAQGYDADAYQLLTTYIEQQRDGAAYALRALMEMPDKPEGFAAYLTGLAGARNDSLREAAVIALGNSDIDSAGTAVADQLLDSSTELQISAINACEQLREAGAPCVQQLTNLMAGADDAEVRAEAAESLHGIVNDTEFVSESVWQAASTAALDDPDEDVRAAAVSIVADMEVDTGLRLVALSEIAVAEPIAYNQSKALGRLARMMGYPGQQVPGSVFQNIATLTNHANPEVARLSGLIMAHQ